MNKRNWIFKVCRPIVWSDEGVVIKTSKSKKELRKILKKRLEKVGKNNE